MDFSTKHQPSADSCADPNCQDIRPGLRRAKLRFSPDCCVDIVLDDDWHSKAFFKNRAKRHLLPSKISCIDHHALFKIDCTRRTDADTVHRSHFHSSFFACAFNRSDNSIDDSVSTHGRFCLSLDSRNNLVMFVDNPDHHVRATKIDTNHQSTSLVILCHR